MDGNQQVYVNGNFGLDYQLHVTLDNSAGSTTGTASQSAS